MLPLAFHLKWEIATILSFLLSLCFLFSPTILSGLSLFSVFNLDAKNSNVEKEKKYEDIKSFNNGSSLCKAVYLKAVSVKAILYEQDK